MSYEVLTDVASVKAWMRSSGTADDNVLTTLIATASELIGRYCSRPNLGAVLSYTESYRPGYRSRANFGQSWTLTLRHYPIVALTSVTVNNAAVTILTQVLLQTSTAGVYLEEDDEPRSLRFQGMTLVPPPTPVMVAYTAGYSPVPAGLKQACNQFVAEILRGNTHINLKSVSAGSETTSYDLGGDYGMSKRVEAMLVPYRNVIPLMGR